MCKTHLTMETIPPEFKRHWKVFSKELSRCYPPVRNPDMAIKFLPDVPTSIKCRPYPQSKDEARIEDEWVKEQVALGRLQKGPSPIVSPVFHINKKDSDEKHIIMDYRRVNAVTVQDHNPISSIWQAMEALHGNSLFLKFDIRWGYCNIRIQKEDQYKAAIQMRTGTYIPSVMYFGLCNAFAFFQRMMQHDFTSLLEGHKDNAGQYMDDFWMATKDDKEGRALHVQMIHKFLDVTAKTATPRLRATLLQVEGFTRRVERYPSPTRRSRAQTDDLAELSWVARQSRRFRRQLDCARMTRDTRDSTCHYRTAR